MGIIFPSSLKESVRQFDTKGNSATPTPEVRGLSIILR